MGSNRSWPKGHTPEDVCTVVMTLIKRRGSHSDELHEVERVIALGVETV